ncbi:hypothetical protein CCACVL1_15225 [Corchorus capsularis]|uniref:Uncharacterized protein n=1 Tax=Corchorus capsularis TaxID=210143 RepID=A0A1R3I359_COCAP|nr:hypothetical protein CCACVL1_15225 [Corchorus capsularis]
MGLKGKLKRKDMEQFNDDFSDFSLSSPAPKIRRLDAELPPIIEEEEAFLEKAIVVYNPVVQVNPNHLHPTLSLNLNPDLISGFKNQIVRATQMKSGDESERKEAEAKEGCLAVIPWVPCQIPIPIPIPSVGSRDDGQVGETELSLMEDEDEMDIEEESNNNNNNDNVKKMEQEQEEFGYGYGYDGLDLKQPSEALQQQHCMIPQPPQNPFTWPLTWSR